jgi:hypothetical protein
VVALIMIRLRSTCWNHHYLNSKRIRSYLLLKNLSVKRRKLDDEHMKAPISIHIYSDVCLSV